MQSDSSFDDSSGINSTVSYFSQMSLDNTKIQHPKEVLDEQFSVAQSSLIEANVTNMNVTVSSSENSFNRINEVSSFSQSGEQHNESSQSISVDINFDTVNRSIYQLNLPKDIFQPIYHSRINQSKEEELSIVDLSVQSQTSAIVNQLRIVQEPFSLDQSSIQILKLNDNSLTNLFIKKETLNQIKQQPLLHQAQVPINQHQEVTLFDHSHSIQTRLLNLQNHSLNSSGSVNVQYDDRGSNDFIPINVNYDEIAKQKQRVLAKRELIRQKQQSIVLKVLKAQKTEIEKETKIKQKKQVQKSRNLPQIKQQNLQVLNEMFCSNEDVIKKRYRGLTSRYYNVFYIDESTPYHNQYVLDLSFRIEPQNAPKPSKAQQPKQKNNQNFKNQGKVKENLASQKNGSKQQDSEGLQNLQITEKPKKIQSQVAKQLTEQRRKYVQERNRKKAERTLQLRKQKEEKLKKAQGCMSAQIEKFNVSMNLLTRVLWENVVSLVMKNAKVGDKEFKQFVNKAHLFPNLMRMDFSSNKITDGGFIYFVDNSYKFEKVFDIFFDQCQITNYGISAFAEQNSDFKFYKRIHLSQNFIDDQGFSTFFSNSAKYPNFMHLEFDGNPKIHKPMTCQGFKIFTYNLKNFNRLKEIHFLNNFISDQGLISFSDQMYHLKQLANLNLGINKITTKGFDYFLNRINQLNSIRKVHFNSNNIQKIPQKSMKNFISDTNPSFISMNLSKNLVIKKKEQNPLQKDRNSCFFLADIFFNMKLKFKLEVFLNHPYTLNLQNMDFSFQRTIQIINGTSTGVFQAVNDDSTRNETIIQEPQEKNEKIRKKTHPQTRFQRLTLLNLSKKKLTTQNWALLVKNINSLPELSQINLDVNNISNITLKQLDDLQQHVVSRNRKQSRILKISLRDNPLNKNTWETLSVFIKKTQNRRIFVMISAKEKQHQLSEDSVILDEEKAYQQTKFQTKINMTLELGIEDLIFSKDIKDHNPQMKLSRMFKYILQQCGSQIENYEKTKILFNEFHEKIKADRVYSTKKDLVDRRWMIIESYFLSQMEKICEGIKKKENCLLFNEEQMKIMLLELGKIKAEKSKNPNKNKQK